MAWKLILFLLSQHAIGSKEAIALYQDAVNVIHSTDASTLGQSLNWIQADTSKKGEETTLASFQYLLLVVEWAFELGLRWMRVTIDSCGGNLERGLAAYATGSCDSPRGLKIARMRLKEIERGISE